MINIRPPWLVSLPSRRRLELDLYDPEYALAIEIQGPRHHSCIEQIRRDLTKQTICKNRGVTLLYVTMKNYSEDVQRIVDFYKLTNHEEKTFKEK